ncbi:DNA-binding transcriptional regulator, XRE family [Halanaerobium congolense]|uniref:DNA-binding transcriptional regulator, XRE family n=1 Tax=Halanaerobium congolense TaxID=54121 RepID=A0A1I0CQT4_9FIRM|nr:helix-turn-helix transcriptional regulator [Halanaerobium congolense]PTX14752.1 DNA-binding Xre family transcriptional regulator [Halanaerobium congolense]PTX14895.1 DNA-binding Xre family transcriptional regulator [Halanaerobium congolense]SDG13425.1 DNA-binding transcriptional regulator, XRE family [Halanaerobium congolense]SET21881.1 DNA-binding transcriptional regulator, XRE family [Halanaerobium congolense]SFP73696.1 DNA-binding transcriptional regulator, XRE family [Halanaerobium cong
MNDHIWANLKKIRNEKNMSLEEVAREIEIAPSSLSRLENGKSPNVSFSTIYDLCSYYNVSLEKIVSEDMESEEYIPDNTEKVTVSEEEMPYYQVAKEARDEGLTVQQTRELILLFKKITSEIQRRNIPDEYCSLALKAKGYGISKSEFKSMVDILIQNKEG